MKIIYETNLTLSSQVLGKCYQWLSSHTKNERFLRRKSSEEIKTESLFSVWAFNKENGELAGGAIVYYGYGMDKKSWLKWDDRNIVELGSNFVLPKYEARGIAKTFVEKRLQYVREQNFFPVSVTENMVMQHVLNKFASPIEEFGEQYLLLRAIMRDCKCDDVEKVDCKICLLANRVMWVFREFLA